FMVGREFAHIHPKPDNGSLHLMLSARDARTVVEKGWSEDHYLVTQGQFPAGLILVFSPRSDQDLEVVQSIVGRSYDHARGESG
ncbi:MAG: luciferase family protein, partial [Verrucomicrobiota bacterium]